MSVNRTIHVLSLAYYCLKDSTTFQQWKVHVKYITGARLDLFFFFLLSLYEVSVTTDNTLLNFVCPIRECCITWC